MPSVPAPPGFDGLLYRLKGSRYCAGDSLRDIEQYWTLEDVLSVTLLLDMDFDLQVLEYKQMKRQQLESAS